MTCMSKPKRLGRDTFVNFRSTRKTRREINDMIEGHIERNRVRLSYRTVSREAVLNSVMLEFMALPLEKQEEILSRRVPEFEARVEAEAPDGETPVLKVRSATTDEKGGTGGMGDKPIKPKKPKGKPA